MYFDNNIEIKYFFVILREPICCNRELINNAAIEMCFGPCI